MQLIVGRVLNGVCVGITSSQVPVYLAEIEETIKYASGLQAALAILKLLLCFTGFLIAKKDKRGSIIVIQQLAIEVGILLMYFIGYGCSESTSYVEPFLKRDTTADYSLIESGFIPGPTASFRVAWGIQWVPCVILLVGLPFLPRSPRWLAKVGRTEEAVMMLAKIQAGGDQADPLVVAEWEEITTVLAAERAALQGWRKFVKNGMWVSGCHAHQSETLSGALPRLELYTDIFNLWSSAGLLQGFLYRHGSNYQVRVAVEHSA